MRLFVYGTLKKGYANNYLLRESLFLGEAETVAGLYRLYAVGTNSFPVLIESPSTYSVQGELYEVSENTLQTLDILEGVGNGFYRRCPIKLKKDLPHNKADLPIIAYLWQKSTSSFQEVPSGDWRK